VAGLVEVLGKISRTVKFPGGLWVDLPAFVEARASAAERDLEAARNLIRQMAQTLVDVGFGEPPDSEFYGGTTENHYREWAHNFVQHARAFDLVQAALAAAPGEPQPRECSCNIERDGCGGSGWKAPGIQCRIVAAPPTSTAEERCATCKGSGRSPHADDECRNCDGRGSYQTAEQRVEALEAALRTLISRTEALLGDYSELHDNDVKHELFAAPTEAAIETARAALSTGGKGGA
jgi:hypothetical protein